MSRSGSPGLRGLRIEVLATLGGLLGIERFTLSAECSRFLLVSDGILSRLQRFAFVSKVLACAPICLAIAPWVRWNAFYTFVVRMMWIC